MSPHIALARRCVDRIRRAFKHARRRSLRRPVVFVFELEDEPAQVEALAYVEAEDLLRRSGNVYTLKQLTDKPRLGFAHAVVTLNDGTAGVIEFRRHPARLQSNRTHSNPVGELPLCGGEPALTSTCNHTN